MDLNQHRPIAGAGSLISVQNVVSMTNMDHYVGFGIFLSLNIMFQICWFWKDTPAFLNLAIWWFWKDVPAWLKIGKFGDLEMMASSFFYGSEHMANGLETI